MQLLKSVRFWLGIGFVVLIIALRYSGLGDYITLETVQEKRMQLEQFVAMHYGWSVLLYIGMYIATVVLALPITILFMVTSGFLFGVVPATLYTAIGATIGATLFFLMVRYLLGNSLQEQYRDQFVWFNEQMRRYGISYLIAVRFLTFIPFFIENTLFGLMKVPVWTFVWTTSVGVVPGSFVYAFAGKQLATITSLQDIFSLPIMFAFALLAALALLPVIIQKFQIWSKS